MSIQVLPTAPSPTVTHLMKREALDAMAARASHRFSEPREGEKRERGAGEETVLEGRDGGRSRLLRWCLVRDFLEKRAIKRVE
jgi:hypothetical protein